MKDNLLLKVDTKDYNPNGTIFKRIAVRGFIKIGNKYAMIHSEKYGEYKFPGGGMEPYEQFEDTLIREVKEETGLTLDAYRLRGVVTFDSDAWPTEYMFLYTADEFHGTMSECDEGTLEWVPKEEVYDLPIWEGDKIFFRLLEERESFFSLKLSYQGDTLTHAILDGTTRLK